MNYATALDSSKWPMCTPRSASSYIASHHCHSPDERTSSFKEKMDCCHPAFNLRSDWCKVYSASGEAYDKLLAHRKSKDGAAAQGISYRYDWRTLLSVIRSILPPTEHLVGPQTQSYIDNMYGGKLMPDVGQDASVANLGSLGLPSGPAGTRA